MPNAKDYLARPGGRLLALLDKRGAALGLTQQEQAAALGVTYGYIAQLRSGMREVANVSDGFLSSCGEFLGLSKLAVMLAAGKLTPADFYQQGQLTPLLEAAWGAMLADAEGAVPAELDLLSQEGKLFVLRLYERAAGRPLLPPMLDRATLAATWPE